MPVSSVSVVPPPPPKNAARLLALALAESAQQAAFQSQKKPDSHSDCNSYAEAESGVTVEMFHPSSVGPPPEQLQLYASVPEPQLSFQAPAPGDLPADQSLPNSSMPEGSGHHQAGKPGSWDHPLLSVDMPEDLHSGTGVGWNHSHFQPRMLGDLHYLDPSDDQSHPYPRPRGVAEPEPRTTEITTDNNSHLPVDKNQMHTSKPHLPICTADDQLQILPIAAGEKRATTVLAYKTNAQTAAIEAGPGVSSQDIPPPPPPPPTTATSNPIITWGQIALMTAQRSLAANHSGAAQRPGDQQQQQQPAMGQVVAAATKASLGLNQVKETQLPPFQAWRG